MKHELSILIPTYNGDCREQLLRLSRQAEAIAGLHYEMVVADDGSTDTTLVERNRQVAARLPHCRYVVRPQNVGRSAIRNYLVSQARYAWVIIMDCEMTITREDYLQRYLCDEGDAPIVYGGITVGQGPRGSLRHLYERQAEPLHTAELRQQNPYKDFHTANFMARRDVLQGHPFDERFRRYGYEDVLLGKQLRQDGIAIRHIDNPVGFDRFESNASFIDKTEQALQTLSEFRDDLRGYAHILTFAEGIHVGAVGWAIRLWHRLLGPSERRRLCGRHPSLRLFKLYKIGYFLTIYKKQRRPKP